MASSHGNPAFQLLFESAPGLNLVLTPDFKIVAVSDAYLRATMTQRDQILGRGIFEVFPDNPDDPAATGVSNLRASLERVLQTRSADTMAVQKYDIRLPEEQGGGFEERHWSPINSPALDPSGALLYIIHRVEDVTDFVKLKQAGLEREKATEALRMRAEKMDAEIFQRAQEVADANQKLRTANQQLALLYEQIATLMTQVGGEFAPQTSGVESPVFTHEMGSQEMLERIGKLIAGHQRLEEELRQSQKMDAVGRLAGGIAHDFNNVLTVITGHCELLLSRIGPKDPLHRRLEDMRSAGERAAELTHQLLAFSRSQVLHPRVVNLMSTLEEMDRMLRRLLGEDIEIVTAISPNLERVKIDPSQVQQVILNLVVNARDAMPHGGKLTLELSNAQITEGGVPHHGVPAGDYVMLAVSDTGTGMTPDVRQRVFEPFFTTKMAGKGNGLGLATVYGIVKQSGGHVWLYSEPGAGTTFRIYFPAVTEAPEPVATRPVVRIEPGSETLLMVEDDDRVRPLVEEILRTAGYRVLAASGGEEAIRICREFEGSIHLLLTDVVLPKMGGKEIAQRLTELRPSLKVLFMSGYTGDAMAHRGILAEPEVEFLQKPFTPQLLCAKVRATLDAGSLARDVLVVDDERAIRDLLTAMLEDAGYRVFTAANGREAREQAQVHPVDVVITDLSMPEEEGIQTIRKLRAQYPDLAIIAMSGAFGPSLLAAAKALGADATLAKPLTSAGLLACIEQVTSKRIRR